MGKIFHKYLILGGFMLSFLGQATVSYAMTEEQLCDLYLGVTESAVDVFEPLWTDYSNTIPKTGFFDFALYGNWRDEEYSSAIMVPGNGMIAYCYAVLLTHTDKDVFGTKKIPRSTLMSHAVKAIRFFSLTSSYVQKPYAYPFSVKGHHGFREDGSWYRPIGSRIDSFGWLTLATGLLMDDLDDQTKAAVESLLVGNAAKERHFRSWTRRGGGLHDTIKQDLAATIGAAFLFPHRDDQDVFYNIITANAIGMVSTEHDQACKLIAQGKPVCDWSLGWNLYPDYSSDHHGWAQIWYGCDLIFEARSYVEIISALTSKPVPETFTYAGNGYDGVLEWAKTLFLQVGEPASVHGMEYDAYYGSGLLAYCYGAVIHKDKIAAALEEQAARLLKRHTQAVGMYDYHRNSWAKAATAFLLHKISGPRAEPISLSEAWDRLRGTYHYKWQQAAIHRASDKWAGFSWGSISHGGRREQALPRGYIVPASMGKAFEEPMIYFHPNSLRGVVKILDKQGNSVESGFPETIYQTSANDITLSTAGTVTDNCLKRCYAFHSFNDGPCVFFSNFSVRRKCRLDWSGLPVYFYCREGMISDRQYSDSTCSRPLQESPEHTSSWWNVDGLISLVTPNDQQTRIDSAVGKNWARTTDYRDKCYGVFVSPLSADNLQPGDTPLNLTVAFYTGASKEQTAEAASIIQGQQLDLPEGWAGALLPNQQEPTRRYLAISNLHGLVDQGILNLSFAEGAPIFSTETIIKHKTSLINLQLAALESFDDTLELYVSVPEGELVQARRESRFSYVLKPLQQGKIKVKLLYTGPQADSITISGTDGSENSSVTVEKFTAKNGYELFLDRAVRLVIENLADKDAVGPAVEIKDIAVREDGQVRVDVEAADQSNIKYVELFRDSVSIGKCLARPFVFLDNPQKGYYTYWAVAVDNSPEENHRESFKRTIQVAFDISKR
ncbi:MAG: hypothetical protein JXD22_06455 [Sedimentisphaerales bacterium]|nr:hypothetical protein [Sedimentisphaerales bacterium]